MERNDGSPKGLTEPSAHQLAWLVRKVLREASPTPAGHRALHLNAKDYYRLLELAHEVEK